MFLSRVTIGALEDLYGAARVNYSAADPFTCPPPAGTRSILLPDASRAPGVEQVPPVGALPADGDGGGV